MYHRSITSGLESQVEIKTSSPNKNHCSPFMKVIKKFSTASAYPLVSANDFTIFDSVRDVFSIMKTL